MAYSNGIDPNPQLWGDLGVEESVTLDQRTISFGPDAPGIGGRGARRPCNNSRLGFMTGSHLNKARPAGLEPAFPVPFTVTGNETRPDYERIDAACIGIEPIVAAFRRRCRTSSPQAIVFVERPAGVE